MMAKAKPTFEFYFPTFFPAKPPFVQIVYENEPLSPVQYEMADRYSRFMSENITFEEAAMPNMFVVTLPTEPRVTVKSVQAVVESLVNGRVKVPMDERLNILRAARLLKVDLLQKALQEHLSKGCRTRTDLKLQCLEMAVAEMENGEFRRERIKDARENFYSIANSKGWVKMNVEVLRELISDDVHLKVNERDLYLAVLKWLVSNPLMIPAHCDRLLGLVRFGSMSTEEKFKCMEEARSVGLDSFVKPYLIEADWYRTCHELNHAEFTDLVEFDRLSHFIGENRKGRAIEAHTPAQRSQKRSSGIAVTIDTIPSALDRAKEGKIQGGTWMPRPRAVSSDASERTSTSGIKGRMSTAGLPENPAPQRSSFNPMKKKCLLEKH